VQDEGTVRYEIERLADSVLDAMPEDPYPLRVMQVLLHTSALAASVLGWLAALHLKITSWASSRRLQVTGRAVAVLTAAAGKLDGSVMAHGICHCCCLCSAAG